MKVKALVATTLVSAGAFAQTPYTGIDKSNMNLDAKPGTDFFEYAAGGWMKAHPLTAEHSRYSQFEALEEANQEHMKGLILGMAEKEQQKGTLAQKIGSLYNLAMDSVRLNAEGWKPVASRLKKINEAANKVELDCVRGQLSRCGVPSFFGLYCDADIKNSKMNLLQINQGGLSMSNRDYYLNDDEATVTVRNAYKDYVKQLFMMTGDTEAVAAQKMEAVLNIETRIAKASYTATQCRDTEANYHKMSFAQLKTEFPGIDWSNLLLQLGYPVVNEVSVNHPEPIHEVEKVLEESSLDELKAYTSFKLLNDAANYLSDDFRAASFNFYSKVMNGAQQDRPRWKRAVDVVDGVLGEAVGKMYVEKYFPESSKKRMTQLVKNLQTALAQRIQEQKWLSPETKKQALDKLAAFYVKIGYPEKWMDYTDLVIDDSLSFYENLSRASEFLNLHEIQRSVNKPVDRNRWYMTPQTINAYYNPTTNEICFPAGILQPPFFNANADDAVNYGAIGVVIGHEMTHGFDDQGSQFDKDGNLRNWWTEADGNNFKKRTKVMEDFFSNIEVLPGLMGNGKLTLGENIADHGGLNVSFQALQNALKENPTGKIDGFTPEQRFFLSYGLIWANNTREALIHKLTKVDPHSLGRWRVNGALPHIDAWYDAFNINKKCPLYLPKSKRVDVW